MKHIYTCKEKNLDGVFSLIFFQDGIIMDEYFGVRNIKNDLIKEWTTEGVRGVNFQYNVFRCSSTKEFDETYEIVLRYIDGISMCISLAKSSFVNPEIVSSFWEKYGNVVISVAKDSEIENTREYTAIVSEAGSYFHVILEVDDEAVAVVSVRDLSFAEGLSSCWQRYHRICIEEKEIDDYGFYIPGIDEPKKEGYSDED